MDNVTDIETKKPGSKAGKLELSMSESYDLMTLIKSEYTQSSMNNSEFAAYAMTKVRTREGILISPSQVASRCDALGIPNNMKNKQAIAPANELANMVLKHEVEVAHLRERLMKLEAWVNQTFPTASGKKVL